MTELHIALLNAAHEADDTRRNFMRELSGSVTAFECPRGELPDDFAYDGFVVTGSSASVYWDKEWIGELKTWVGGAIEAGLPALGVCYGHQLLADVLGGRVEDMGEYEIGYRTVEHDGENRLLEGIDESMTVFTTHSDRVADPPPGATVFAKNEYGIHGFRSGDAIGVQFHPEYDMQTAEMVTKNKDEQLPEEKLTAVLDGIHAENYEAACEAKQLFENFLAFVEEKQTDCVAAD